MVDGSEGQVLMGVYHDPNNTNLYISEEAGLNYSLSLEHLISPPESDWIDSLVRGGRERGREREREGERERGREGGREGEREGDFKGNK